jgi:hypothetical protein
MSRINVLVSHLWMVRTFLKHCEEAEEDEDLQEVYRGLYDFMMALAGPAAAAGPEAFLKIARKKLRKLRETADLFLQIQPEISTHTNFQMAAQSLKALVEEISAVLATPPAGNP